MIIAMLIHLLFGVLIPGPNHLAESYDCCPVMMSTSEFDILYDPKYYSLYFDPIEYDYDNGVLSIQSKTKIQSIEIIQREQINQRLMVMADNLALNKSIFSESDATIRVYFKEGRKSFDLLFDFR